MADTRILRVDSGRFSVAGPPPGTPWKWRALAVLAPAVAALILPAKYGFHHSAAGAIAIAVLEALLGVYFSIRTVSAFVRTRNVRLFLKERGGELVLLGLLALATAFLWAAEGRSIGWAAFAAVLEVYLGLNVLLALVRAERAVLRLHIRPAQVFLLSYLAFILLGAVLLYFLPRATRSAGGLSFLDALFTATSATCVTGLTVVDTGETFTRLGQMILALLMQTGGLGVMIFGAFVALALGKGMGLRERELMRSSLNLEFVGDMGRLVLFILLSTVLIEAAGAAATLLLGVGAGHPEGPVWFAVFHAVSAFCNAGFALTPTNYEPYAGNAPFLFVQMALIVMGGLGFAVLRDLRSLPSLLPRRVRRALAARGFIPAGAPHRMSLHTWIVLVVSGSLVAIGFFAFLALEWRGTLEGFGPAGRTLNALFLSVSARTAGFNSVPMGALATPTLLLLMVLMFIGAAPSSTGGGIKTSTFAIVVLDVVRTFRGRADVEIRGRRIPPGLVDRAMVLALVSAGLVIVCIFLLTVLEPGIPIQKLAFEIVSAFGTVGLSTGITAELSPAGKIVIMILMFVGRLGPMTLVWAMGTETAKARYHYPTEGVNIG